jgi:hypothetical protein
MFAGSLKIMLLGFIIIPFAFITYVIERTRKMKEGSSLLLHKTCS